MEIFTTSDGIKISYRFKDGNKQKETLFFFHGLGGNMNAWNFQLSYFQKLGYPTVVFDLRGHGLSSRPKKLTDYSIEKITNDILNFIKSRQFTKIILIGHCFGGRIALKTAEKLKINPKAVIIISTSTSPSKLSKFLSRHSKWLSVVDSVLLKSPLPLGKAEQISFEKFNQTGDFNLLRIASDIFHTTLPSYLALCLNYLTILSDHRLQDINCPTLIIHGGHDHIFPITSADYLHQKIKHSQLVILPNANHIIPLNNKKELSQQIDKFLQTLN